MVRNFARYSNRGTRYTTANASQNITGGVRNSGKNYGSEGSGTRRHEFISKIPGMDSMSLGDYATLQLASFRRSFDAAQIDDEPAATASNNFQDSRVMNGSKLVGYQCNVKISNTSSSEGSYIDVYSLVTSFYDAQNMDDVYPSETPLQQDLDGVNVGRLGEVSFKSTHVIWTENTYKNFKGLQRHIKYLGTLYTSSEDGGSPEAQFMIKGLPAKCRRSQQGMFYGLMFHYGSDKNSTATASFDASADIKFTEIPSSNRIPFRW